MIRLVICSLFILVIGEGNGISQETKTLTIRTGSDVRIGNYKEIPKAT